MKKLALVGLAGVVAAMGIAAPGIAGGNKYAAEPSVRDCGEGDTVTLDGPLKLWPPNHKFVAEPVTIESGFSDTEGVKVVLTFTPTDAEGGDGGAQHDPDVSADETLIGQGEGSATAQMELRAERSGKGDGRTYTIDWTGTWGPVDGVARKTCSSSQDGQSPFIIEVPHDMRGGADWK